VSKALVLEPDSPDIQSHRFLTGPAPSSLLGTVLPLDLPARIDNVRGSFDSEIRKLIENMQKTTEEVKGQCDRKVEVLKSEASKAKQELVAFRAF
jgi:hypothetical protein